MLSLGPRADRWPKVQTLTPKPCGERAAAQSKNEASNLYPEEPGDDLQLLQSRSFKRANMILSVLPLNFLVEPRALNLKP